MVPDVIRLSSIASYWFGCYSWLIVLADDSGAHCPEVHNQAKSIVGAYFIPSFLHLPAEPYIVKQKHGPGFGMLHNCLKVVNSWLVVVVAVYESKIHEWDRLQCALQRICKHAFHVFDIADTEMTVNLARQGQSRRGGFQRNEFPSHGRSNI